VAGSNTLIETLAHLQHHVSSAYSRRLLLNYARRCTGARLGLLFRIDASTRQLALVEQCGQPPRREYLSEYTRIDMHGLFGAALHHQGVLEILDSYSDPRSLPVERGWTWRGGRVQICAAGSASGSDIAEAQGIMVLCAGQKASEIPVTEQAESEVLICAALLAAFLEDTPEEDEGPHAQTGEEGDEGDRKGPHSIPLRPRPYNDYGDGMLAARVLLGELELLVEVGLDERELQRKVLDYLGRELRASGGSLWLYQPARGRFAPGVNAGMDAPSLALVTDTLLELAGEQPGMEVSMERGLRVITESRGYMLVLHPLCCTGQLLGAVAFSLKGGDELPVEQRALFAQMCDVAAIVLRSHQLRVEELQAAIDRERSRIARDMHDGAAQGIAHALHALEFAQRMLDKQPQIAQREIRRARETLLESLNDLRHAISTLLPVQLEQANFDEAVRALLDDFSKHEPAIALRYEAAQPKHLPPSLEVPVFRLLQESLNNVRKHARASQVSVQVQSLPGLLVAQVSDDGAGFDLEQARRDSRVMAGNGASANFGLRSMQERVEQAGGVLDIVSKPGAGTTVKVHFPLASPPTALTAREREVLRLLVDGSTNRVIAAQLSVSMETVKSHVHHIMQKLQVKDRTQAAVLAARQQWV